jgi:hypothetical protein
VTGFGESWFSSLALRDDRVRKSAGDRCAKGLRTVRSCKALGNCGKWAGDSGKGADSSCTESC